MTIGEKIKVILEYRHMTVQELSVKMGYIIAHLHYIIDLSVITFRNLIYKKFVRF